METVITFITLSFTMVALLVGYPLWFAYLHDPLRRRAVWGIPPGSVVFAPGFQYQGEDELDVIEPGPGNRYLAHWLDDHAEDIALVLTQKAISDALPDPVQLRDSTPVFQMHAHRPDLPPVRTFEALHYALERLPEHPVAIVLIVHPKHYRRTRRNLAQLYDGQIIAPYLYDVPYRNESLFAPLWWALREIYIANPAEYLHRNVLGIREIPEVKLEKIELPITPS